MTANLKAVLGLDSKPYHAGLKSAKAGNEDFKANLKSVASALGVAFSVGAVVNMGKALVKWAGDLSEAAQNMGIATSEMMALNEAAAQGGLQIGDLQKMLARLQSELFNAAKGETASAEKFTQMGLSIKDLIALDPVSMLQEVAKAALATNTPVATLADLFGEKLGPRAVSALKDIAENGLPQVSTEAGKAADEIERMGDEWAAFVEKTKQGAVGFAAKANKAMGAVGTFVGGAIGGSGGIGNRMKQGKAALDNDIEMEVRGEEAIRKEKAAEAQRTADELSKMLADSVAKKQAVKDKADADELARVTETNDAMRRAQLEGLEKMRADYLKAQADNDQAMIDAPTEAVRTALNDRRWLMIEAYAKDVKDFKKAEAEKKKAAEDALINPMQAKQDALEGQVAAIQQNTRGGTVNRGNQAAVGGFTGGMRAGYEVESKGYRVQVETKQVLEEIKLIVAQIELARTLSAGVY